MELAPQHRDQFCWIRSLRAILGGPLCQPPLGRPLVEGLDVELVDDEASARSKHPREVLASGLKRLDVMEGDDGDGGVK